MKLPFDVRTVVHVLLILLVAYASLGLALAVPFLAKGAARLDPGALGATWGFRLIIVPGVVALWPWLAWRWWRGNSVNEHNAHRDRAGTEGGRP